MTYTNFKLETDADGIALLTWDMPGRSMNVFTEDALEELDRIVTEIIADEAVKGVVLTWLCPRSRSASSPAPVAPSACRACATPKRHSRC